MPATDRLPRLQTQARNDKLEGLFVLIDCRTYGKSSVSDVASKKKMSAAVSGDTHAQTYRRAVRSSVLLPERFGLRLAPSALNDELLQRVPPQLGLFS